MVELNQVLLLIICHYRAKQPVSLSKKKRMNYIFFFFFYIETLRNKDSKMLLPVPTCHHAVMTLFSPFVQIPDKQHSTAHMDQPSVSVQYSIYPHLTISCSHTRTHADTCITCVPTCLCTDARYVCGNKMWKYPRVGYILLQGIVQEHSAFKLQSRNIQLYLMYSMHLA